MTYEFEQPRLFVIVERAECWRLEIYTKGRPLGRCTHEGSVERLILIAGLMEKEDDEIHILPRTAADWYAPTERYRGAP